MYARQAAGRPFVVDTFNPWVATPGQAALHVVQCRLGPRVDTRYATSRLPLPP